MGTWTQWAVDSTADRLHTDDDIPPGKMRERMRRDATRWARQGLVFEGVRVDRDPAASSSTPSYVIAGDGYRLHMLQRDGHWPVDALTRASQDDWSEVTSAPEGICPHCEAVVQYDDWIAVSGEPALMACPNCRRSTRVDSIYPPLDTPAQGS